MGKIYVKGKAYGETNEVIEEYIESLEQQIEALEKKIRENNIEDITTVYFDSEDLLKLNSKADGEAFCKVEIKEGGKSTKCFATCKVQGNTSAGFPKKNYTVKFYEDDTLSKKFKIDMGWGKQSKYCFKANWIDATHVRNVLGAKIMGEAAKTRPDSDFKELITSAPNMGLVDGFPIVVMVNGQFHGLYTWNIPKDAWLYNLNEKNTNHVLYCSDFHTDVTAFKSIWNTTTDPELDDWELEVGTESQTLYDNYNRMARFIIQATDSEFRENINDYIDLYSVIDYYCFCALSFHPDGITKNMILVSYDGGIHWGLGLYDMDATFCLHWNGQSFYDIDSYGVEWDETNNRLLDRVRNCFSEELYARYLELRDTYLSLSYISEVAEKISNKFTDKLKNLEFTKWPGIPQQSTNTVDKFKEIVYQRGKIVDQRMARIEWGEIKNPDEPYSLSDNPIQSGDGWIKVDEAIALDGGPCNFDDEFAFYGDVYVDWAKTYTDDSNWKYTRIAAATKDTYRYHGDFWYFSSNSLTAKGDDYNGYLLYMSNYILDEKKDTTDPINTKFVICKRRIYEDIEDHSNDEFAIQIFLDDGNSLTLPCDNHQDELIRVPSMPYDSSDPSAPYSHTNEFFYKAGFCPTVENISKLLYRADAKKSLDHITINGLNISKYSNLADNEYRLGNHEDFKEKDGYRYVVPITAHPFEAQPSVINIERLPLPYYASAAEKANPGATDANHNSITSYSLGYNINRYYLTLNSPASTKPWGRDRYKISIPEHKYTKNINFFFTNTEYTNNTPVYLGDLANAIDTNVHLFDEDRDFFITLTYNARTWEHGSVLYPSVLQCFDNPTQERRALKSHIKIYEVAPTTGIDQTLSGDIFNESLLSHINNGNEIRIVLVKRGHTLCAFARNATLGRIGGSSGNFLPDNFIYNANATLLVGYGDNNPNMDFKEIRVGYGSLTNVDILSYLDYQPETDLYTNGDSLPFFDAFAKLDTSMYLDEKYSDANLATSNINTNLTIMPSSLSDTRNFAIFSEFTMNHDSYTQSADWYPGIFSCYNARINNDTSDLIFFGVCDAATGNIKTFVLNHNNHLKDENDNLLTSTPSTLLKCIIFKRGWRLIAIIRKDNTLYYTYQDLDSENYDPNDGAVSRPTLHVGHGTAVHAENYYHRVSVQYGDLEDSTIQTYFGSDIKIPDALQAILDGE